MRKTEHYGLNLWDLEDRIKMEDFNSDNAKLDAALASFTQGGAGLLLDTFNGEGPYGSIYKTLWDWSEPLGWDEYSLVLIMGHVTRNDPDAAPYAALLYAASPMEEEEESTKFSFSPGGFLYVLTPMRDPSRLVEGFFLSGGAAASFRGTKAFDQIRRFKVGGKKNGVDATVNVQNLRAIGIR